MNFKVLEAEGLIENGSLNFDLLKDLIKNSKEPSFIFEMSFENQILFFKLLFDNQKYDILAEIVQHKSLSSLETTPLVKLILAHSFKKSQKINHDEIKPIISSLTATTAFFLLPFRKKVTSEEEKKIEYSYLQLKSKNQNFKTELLDQVQFLKNQQLFDKEIEIRQRLEFHFPSESDKVDSKQTHPKKLERSKDLSFSKLIERNLSFESRKKKRLSKDRKLNLKEKEETDQVFLQKMIRSWVDVFEKDFNLLLTQISFLDIDFIQIYEDILDLKVEIDDWTKVTLYLKAERFYEGLSFLLSIEKNILDNNPADVYHYYYYKALFYYKTGMTEEAEKLFKLIHEQKENFRDVKFYLSN